jgi:hypothetical protein
MMKQSPIEKYTSRLHENIFEKILGMLYIAKMKPALKVAEKMLDDPEFKAHIEDIRYTNEKLANYLKNWCKYNPDDPLCNKSRKK